MLYGSCMGLGKKKNSETMLERKKSFLERAKELLNLAEVKKAVRLGSAVATAVAPFIEKPTVWNAASAAFSIGKVFVDDLEFWPDDYFMGDEWSEPYSREFNVTILETLTKKPYQTIRTSDDTNVIKIVYIDDIKLGYVLNTKLNIVNHLYVETRHLARARQIIKKLLWDQYKDANLVMRQNKRSDAYEARIVFETDDAFKPLPSKRAAEYSAYLKKCITAGVPRSVMLYGPPGTGKSTMARTIVDTLTMKSFRIRVEDVSGLDSATLFEAVSIFEPDSIILDDFDRAHDQARLLETLEFFQRHVKLVIATVNNRNNLDEAIMRPGRFDELVNIKQMDEDVVKAMLGPDHADAFDIVKEWPIAFIEEYVKRRKFMTVEEAAMSTVELAKRVKRLSKYEDDDDDMSRMYKLVEGDNKAKLEEENEDEETEQVDDEETDQVEVIAYPAADKYEERVINNSLERLLNARRKILRRVR